MKKKPVKKYAYGGGIQPTSSTPTSGVLGGIMGMSKMPSIPTGSMSGAMPQTIAGTAPRGFGPNDAPPPVTGPRGVGLTPRGLGPNDGGAAMAPGGMGPRGMGRSMDGPGMTRGGFRGGPRGRPMPKTGGPNPGIRQQAAIPAPGSAVRSMAPMAAQQIMPTGRAFAKGGMVGCDWKAPSSKTMRGAARKGK
jgi:hypothetical protein